MNANFILKTLLFSAILLVISPLRASIIFVNSTAIGNNDGTTWGDAFLDLQQALLVSSYGDEIWVAQGIYHPTSTTNREISFEPKNGVKLYGGFAGHESLLTERDFQANKTVLSGDIGVQGDANDNSHTIVYLADVDSSTCLDGFILSNGNANGNPVVYGFYSRARNGGAIYITANNNAHATEPKITNCVFRLNSANQRGGAMFIYNQVGFAVNPLFQKCQFVENYANFGGAINIFGGNNENELKLTECLFELNSSFSGGAVQYDNNYGSRNLVFEGCEFSYNFSDDIGGVFYIESTNLDNSSVILDNCKAFENSASEGAVISCAGFEGYDRIFVVNSNFERNYAISAGVFSGYNNGRISIENCRFSDNSAIEAYGCFDFYGISLFINNSIFENCVAQSETIFRFGSPFEDTLLISNCTFINNQAPEGLSHDSQGGFLKYEIHNSIFYGNMTNDNGELFTDYEGGIGPSSNLFVSNSLFENPTCESLSETPITCSTTLFATDPIFLDTAAADYRLHPCSPARNAGSNAAAQAAGLVTDIAGLPRIQEGTVDMGAHETPAFAVGCATVTAPPCTVGALASVELSLDWGCPPFFLSWAEAAGGGGTGFSDTSLALLQLPPGSYTVTVTDGRTQATTTSFTIAPPTPLTATLDATAVQCATGTGPSTGGIATATPLGGTGPFTYSWNGGQTTTTATDLPPGQATVTITDANGCTATSSVLIGLVGDLQVGVNIIEPFFCHGEQDGVVQAVPFGGTPPFAYQWEGLPWEQSPTLDSIGPGSYSATVTDALGCTGEVQFNFGEPASISVSVEVEHPACHGGMGSATATASGGTPDFSYLWDTGGTGVTAMLLPGIHSVTAMDANGCTGTAQLLVTEPPLLTAFVAAQPQTLCFEANNGQIAALPQGGTPPYAYDWGDSLPPDSLLTGIGPGNYTLTLTDANGCSATASADVAEHLDIIAVLDSTANASGPGIADGGVAIASVSGGTGSGYAYSWSNGSNSQDLVGVVSGDYSLTVTDAQGCTASFSFFVDISLSANSAQPNPFGAAIVPNPSGKGTKARVQLSKAGGGLVFSVFDEAGRLVATNKVEGMTFELPQGLSAGSYRVVLQDGERRAVLNWVVGE